MPKVGRQCWPGLLCGPRATCPAARNREPRLPAAFRALRDAAAFKGCTGTGDLPARVTEARNLLIAKEVIFA